MAQQVLNIQLPGIVLDGPSGEGVPETVSVGPGHAGHTPQPLHPNPNQVPGQRTPCLGRAEELPFSAATEAAHVEEERLLRPLPEPHYPLLVALPAPYSNASPPLTKPLVRSNLRSRAQRNRR